MRLLAVLLVAIIGTALFWLSREEELGFSSPIPKVFGTIALQRLNTWFPKGDFSYREEDLYIGAKSAIAVDYKSGKVILAKNHNERLPVASTLKIMTALVALESTDTSVEFRASDNAASVGENSMGLSAGEQLTIKELLYGLMLVSGNDAALTIAEGIAGSESAFVKMMNEKARSLGLRNTYFVNATGLDQDGGNSYSTAYDMVTIAHYTWENYPIFRQITSTVSQYIEATDTHKAFDLYNDTNLLTTYPGVKGIKPGFTWEAGLCLVTYAENGDKEILAVILGSDDRRGEMKELLDYSFASFGIIVSHPGLDI